MLKADKKMCVTACTNLLVSAGKFGTCNRSMELWVLLSPFLPLSYLCYGVSLVILSGEVGWGGVGGKGD